MPPTTISPSSASIASPLRSDDVEALSGVSFEAFEGESRVILGAAGSGKTVLLKTALGLVKPDSGEVYAFGENLTALSERSCSIFAARSACCSRKARYSIP
jgi:ABC-type multidrug transport system ATPase subunit